jgi:hypothetical protein
MVKPQLGLIIQFGHHLLELHHLKVLLFLLYQQIHNKMEPQQLRYHLIFISYSHLQVTPTTAVSSEDAAAAYAAYQQQVNEFFLSYLIIY